MAAKRPRGRPHALGKYYRFGLRFRPGFDPPELEELLELIEQASGAERAAILRAALLGGAAQAQEEAYAEGEEAEDVLNSLFDTF